MYQVSAATDKHNVRLFKRKEEIELGNLLSLNTFSKKDIVASTV